MPKMRVRAGKLTVAIPPRIMDEIAARDGDEMVVSTEGSRIVLTPAAVEPSPEERSAIAEGEAEFAEGKTRRLSDVLHDLGRTAKQ